MRADRGGEGQLHDRVDVRGCWACRGRRSTPGATGPRRHRGPAPASWPRRCGGCSTPSRQTSGCRRVAAAAQPGRARVQRRAGRRPDARARPAGGASRGPTSAPPCPARSRSSHPDLIGRDFDPPARPGERLVGDITYLRDRRGLALPGHRDRPGHPDGRRLAAGRPHAHQPGHRRPADGHRRRPRRALTRSSTPTAAPNTPRASSPSSARTNSVRTSLGRTGVCWDNAAAESFFAALKNEMYYRQHFAHPSPSAVRRRRLHRGLLQPPAAALHPRLPHPARSPHRPPTQQPPLPDQLTRGTVQDP